jgi:two-component system phosphate regulon sensor histidine kinase PhoR
MTASKTQAALPVTTLCVAVGIALAWVAEAIYAEAPSITIRALMLGGGVCVAVAGAVTCSRRALATREVVQRQFDVLCHLELHQLTDSASGAIPSLGPQNPWRTVFDRVREALMNYATLAREAELGRTTSEIRALRNSQRAEQLELILAGMSEPVIAIDEFDDIVLSNPSASQLFQLEGAAAERRVLGDVVKCQKLVDLMQETRRRKLPTTRSLELELKDGEGKSHWYNATARGFALGSSEATPSGAVAVLRDIGGVKALQKRNAEFVSAVSHEMKTPLAGIKAYVELLADGEAKDEAEREEYLEVINSQADRLQRLVDNMLNLARIEAGVVSVNKQALSLNDLLEEAAHVIQPCAEQKQIALQCELSELYLGVACDRDMILQAAINLLSNAVKYTPDGGTVTLRSRLLDRQVQFEVSDTGVGLSPEDCSRVFEKFYRVKKDQKMAPGTGLGLALAKHIVEDVHGGALTVESELGVGSTFLVTLVRAAHQPKNPSHENPTSGLVKSR